MTSATLETEKETPSKEGVSQSGRFAIPMLGWEPLEGGISAQFSLLRLYAEWPIIATCSLPTTLSAFA